MNDNKRITVDRYIGHLIRIIEGSDNDDDIAQVIKDSDNLIYFSDKNKAWMSHYPSDSQVDEIYARITPIDDNDKQYKAYVESKKKERVICKHCGSVMRKVDNLPPEDDPMYEDDIYHQCDNCGYWCDVVTNEDGFINEFNDDPDKD